MKKMKRILSVAVMLCMLLSLLTGFAFAGSESTATSIVANGGWISVYQSSCDASGKNVSHTGNLVISGSFECLKICEAGTYNITLHGVDAYGDYAGYYTLEVSPNVQLNLTLVGANTFYHENGVAAMVNSASKIVLNFEENSSLSMSSNNSRVFQGLPTLEMKDGSDVPGTDEENWHEAQEFSIQVGTPLDCDVTYKYAGENECNVYCTDHDEVLGTKEHTVAYLEKGQGHIRACLNCHHEFGEVSDHVMVYCWKNENTCQQICMYCQALGESKSHNMSAYDYYDETYCINYCAYCGNNGTSPILVPHKCVSQYVEATKYEVGYTQKTCEQCEHIIKEYDRDEALYFELFSFVESSWDKNAVLVYVNGEPTQLIRKLNDGMVENFAMHYDENSSYSFRWLGKENDSCALNIYLPEEDEPVFSKESMWEYSAFDEFFSLNAADYSEVEAALAEIPETLEYYTKDSVGQLVTALKGTQRMLPDTQQSRVDAMATALKSAVDGLVPTDEPTACGVINLVGGTTWIYAEDDGYVRDDEWYDYKGPYTVFSSDWEYTSDALVIDGGKADITFVNTFIRSESGNFGILSGSDAKVKFLGANAFISYNNNWYAGIDVQSGAKLTIEKSSDSVVAFGGENCAGIGGVEEDDAGEITVNGGVIYALSPDDGAGIGGGYLGDFEKITINGGRVHAECLMNDGAGIGCGDDGYGGDIIINGGDITALSLYDDGAGIGGADNGYCESITINGGNIIVGSDDAAGIGAGQEAESLAGKIVINGGVIKPHYLHDLDECLIGNGDIDAPGMSKDNFVQINGGAIFDDGCRVPLPAPVNKDGKAVSKISFKVHKSYNGKDVTLQLDNGAIMRVPVVDGQVQTYAVKGVKVLNQASFKNSTSVKAVDTSKIFNDVQKKDWFKSAVDYSYAHGLINGVKKDEFDPESSVTRGMFITILARMSGVDTSAAANKSAKTPFKDVKKGEYYAAAVSWASKAGIVSGTSATTFAPDAPIERQQLCVMVVNYAKFNGIELKAKEKAITFADAGKIQKYARAALKTCQRADIINGYNEGGKMLVKPANTATRAEAAKILASFHQNFVAK